MKSVALAAVLLLAQDGAQALRYQDGTVVQVQRGMSREEMDWRRRHPEIPPYMPYTPGYGPYNENGRPRWQGIPDPYYREEYPRIDYYYIYRRWRYGPR